MRRTATFREQRHKAIGAFTGAGIGGALTVIVVWIIESSFALSVPTPVVGAITTLVGAVVGYLSSYYAPRNVYR